MKRVKYEISVFMETEAQVSDQEAEHLVMGAKDAIQNFVEAVWAELGLDACRLLEGRLYVDGARRAKVCGKKEDWLE